MKSINYPLLAKQLDGLLDKEHSFITNAAQFSAFMFYQLTNINWAGFYLLNEEYLELGPFQGKPACAQISLIKGACGLCARTSETVVLQNVNEFPDHIVCDTASKSEIVLPVTINNKLIGVFDIDSDVIGNFNEEDKLGFEGLMRLFREKCCHNKKKNCPH